MNKEDSIKEKFKQALQSTYKVISDDYKVDKNTMVDKIIGTDKKQAVVISIVEIIFYAPISTISHESPLQAIV